MNIAIEMSDDLKDLLSGCPKQDRTILAEAIGKALKSAIIQPAPERARRGGQEEFTTELIVASRTFDVRASIKISNLVRNAVDPRTAKQVFALGSGAVLQQVGSIGAWIAFVAAVMGMLARSVGYAEACVLHKAWRIKHPSAIFTARDLEAVGQEIFEEYGLHKVTAIDIATYLENLERAGALSGSAGGYLLVERVWMRTL